MKLYAMALALWTRQRASDMSKADFGCHSTGIDIPSYRNPAEDIALYTGCWYKFQPVIIALFHFPLLSGNSVCLTDSVCPCWHTLRVLQCFISFVLVPGKDKGYLGAKIAHRCTAPPRGRCKHWASGWSSYSHLLLWLQYCDACSQVTH